MKKILIISYFFPPCNLTASNRVYSWAKYLKEFGYEPIVITRNWDIKILNEYDVLRKSGDDLIHKKTEDFEVYYLPYRQNLRDFFYVKSYNNRFYRFFSKVLTFLMKFFEKKSIVFLPYSNFYFGAKKIIKEKEISGIIISGNPFEQFSIGYKLSKKFDIPWIADYRDAWTTRDLSYDRKRINYFLHKLDQFYEKKWLSNCSLFTSVSSNYILKINNLIKKKGVLISNGYDLDCNIESKNDSEFNSSLVLSYVGKLYSNQNIESFFEVIEKLKYEGFSNVKIEFIGTNFDKDSEKRILNLCNKNSVNVDLIDRMSLVDLQLHLSNTDVFLMFSYGDLKGIPSSKLYEYIGLKKRVLLFPNDYDIIEETLNNVGNGIICNNEKDLFLKLKDLIKSKRNLTFEKNLILDQKKVEFYSRRNQTKLLARILDNVF